MSIQFDEEFAGPREYASLYRQLGLQVVPAKSPSEDTSWKRPIVKWREHENELVDQATFDNWYGAWGEHNRRTNMGVISGKASGNLLVVDIDLQKFPRAKEWWDDLVDLYNHGIPLQTPTQRTGGGGLQIFLQAPEWYTPPTNKTTIGVDIRGQGGFAVIPPSLHESGKNYEWLKGYEPWVVELQEAPVWSLEAIDQLLEEYGGVSAGPREKTESAGQSIDAFGSIVDGREDYMRRLIWARIVDLYRDCPILAPATMEEECRDAFSLYATSVKSRIAEPGTDNAVLLEREGRGWTEFRKKWHIALSKWAGPVKEAASIPKKASEDRVIAPPAPVLEMVQGDDGVFRPKFEPFTLYSVTMIKEMPDPKWLVDGMIVENGLGFVAGPPGCGKSFCTISLALAIAAGLPEWQGKTIHKHGPVIYISSEGVSDLKFRITAWEQETGISAADIPFYLISQPINFMDNGEIARLINTIKYSDLLTGIEPVLVVVDTVSRSLPGADENLQKDMTMFIKACDEVRVAFGSTVCGVHHTSRQGNLRGSTVFDGAADFIFMMERESGNSIGTLTARKIKSAQDGWELSFRLKPVEIPGIVPQSSLYFEFTAEKPDAPRSEWPSMHVCRQILRAMSEAWDDSKPWSTQPNTRRDGRYAAVLMARWDVEERTANIMLNDWLLNGVIEVEMRDTKTRTKGIRVINYLYGD
jgi:hypothetical protein